jgi:hypothetical protein
VCLAAVLSALLMLRLLSPQSNVAQLLLTMAVFAAIYAAALAFSSIRSEIVSLKDLLLNTLRRSNRGNEPVPAAE